MVAVCDATICSIPTAVDPQKGFAVLWRAKGQISLIVHLGPFTSVAYVSGTADSVVTFYDPKATRLRF